MPDPVIVGEPGTTGTAVTLSEAEITKLKALGHDSVAKLLEDYEIAKRSVSEGTRKISEQGAELGNLREQTKELRQKLAAPPMSTVDATKELDALTASLKPEQQKFVDESINKLDEQTADEIEKNPAAAVQFIRDVLKLPASYKTRSLFKRPVENPATLRNRYAAALNLAIDEQHQTSPITGGGLPTGRLSNDGVTPQIVQRIAGGNTFLVAKEARKK